MLKLSKTKTVVQTIDRYTAWINLVALALILMIGLLYIVQVNRATTKGYQMRTLEDQIELLGIENQHLEMKVAENKSVASINERVQMLGMVPATTPDYVAVGTPTVALNR